MLTTADIRDEFNWSWGTDDIPVVHGPAMSARHVFQLAELFLVAKARFQRMHGAHVVVPPRGSAAHWDVVHKIKAGEITAPQVRKLLEQVSVTFSPGITRDECVSVGLGALHVPDTSPIEGVSRLMREIPRAKG